MNCVMHSRNKVEIRSDIYIPTVFVRCINFDTNLRFSKSKFNLLNISSTQPFPTTLLRIYSTDNAEVFSTAKDRN